jgi:hypothetical protein
MSDDRRFRPTIGTFDETYPQHHGAGLVALALRIADGLNRRNFVRWFAAHVEGKAENLNPLRPTSDRHLAGSE